MKEFSEKLAVVTGAGTGMGRELAKQLAAAGCHVAFCDVAVEAMAATQRECEALAPPGTKITCHACDVSDEAQVLAFRDAVKAQHRTERINLLFNNAGIGGVLSFVVDDRADWEKTFGVCWFGVYYCARAFMPMLVASDEGCIVNTSSVNGFWASLGPASAHTAYSSAKFAVKGFTESLINDLRIHAPHVTAVLVMPGHVGTDIGLNSRKVLGKPPLAEMGASELTAVRQRLKRQGLPVEKLSDDQVRSMLQQRGEDFRDKAPLSAAGAATIILDGIRAGRWRILVGEDAKRLDERVRQSPEAAYDREFFEGWAATRRSNG
jgi:NAD(P)-dependent dehydrogenase (short-subunit alcohol dehydrogenase family)